MKVSAVFVSWALLFAVAAPLYSQSEIAIPAHRAEAPKIDGVLDDAAWRAAASFAGFTQLDPAEGQPPSEVTTFRAVIDDGALYIAIRAEDREPARIVRGRARRDVPVEADYVTISIDSRHDHRTAYVFTITAGGARSDAAIPAEGNPDLTWDAVWSAAVEVDTGGWSAEVRIPFSQLRFIPGTDEWGIQVKRFISRKQETDLLAFVPKRELEGPIRYAHLTGMRDVRSGTRIETTPYVILRQTASATSGTLPAQKVDAGADVTYSFDGSTRLRATLNPDFGQIEADPAEVNLGVFETLLTERRSFFVEDADLFAWGGPRGVVQRISGFPRVVYTRRIGRPPAPRAASPGATVQLPQQTRILGAAKLAGKTGPYSYAVLNTVTAAEDGRQSAGTVTSTMTVEPLTNFLIGRLRRETSHTNVGVIFTGVVRDLADSSLAAVQHRTAYVGGSDLTQMSRNRVWQVYTAVVASAVTGEPLALIRTQRNSAHYFQRPDASNLGVDSSANSLTGHGLRFIARKVAGRHWLGAFTLQSHSPGLEVNDAGFSARSDFKAAGSLLTYKEDKPGRLFRRWQASNQTALAWTGDGVLGWNDFMGQVDAQFHNYWSVRASGTFRPSVADDRWSRGGPLMQAPEYRNLQLEASSDVRRRVSATARLRGGRDDKGSREKGATVELSLRPSPMLQARVDVSADRNRYVGQYVMTRPDQLSPTYGNRYIFSTLEQTLWSATARMDWTLTPETTIQLFLQPLLSAVQYHGFKELARGRSFEFNEYGKDVGTITRTADNRLRVDPDDGGPAPAFDLRDDSGNLQSLRGTAVFRWEFRPGSTLFAVWQARGAENLPYAGVRGGDAGALASVPLDNSFALKIAYRLGK
jgi:hypothetical protein